MGLELAELAMAIEERYAIELDEDAWKDVRTFGDLVDSVKRLIDQPLDPPIEESRNEIILQSLLAELRLRLPKDVEVNEETQLNKLKPYIKSTIFGRSSNNVFPNCRVGTTSPICLGELV